MRRRRKTVFFLPAIAVISAILLGPAPGEARWVEKDGILHPGPGAETWIEIEGVTYGARPGDRGPIGGGEGYTATVTGGDYTVHDLDGLIAALAEAKSGETVFIPGETEIDLTTRVYVEKLVLEVPEGVTLAGERGHGGSRGALLKSDTQATREMLRITGNDVRITGLRLRGPNPEQRLDHHRRSFGPGGGGHEYYYRFPTQSGIRITWRSAFERLEVDNCDISGFGWSGVFLAGGTGHHVHHNHIHHCRHHGLGYGVYIDKASVLIEFNLFDYNRHSIAGTGAPGSSYVARHNVQLGVSSSHDFDMHGGSDRGDGTQIAGRKVEIHNNTFLSREVPVWIRGVPEETSQVRRNWFVRRSGPAAAVIAGGNTVVSDNLFGREPAAPE